MQHDIFLPVCLMFQKSLEDNYNSLQVWDGIFCCHIPDSDYFDLSTLTLSLWKGPSERVEKLAHR